MFKDLFKNSSNNFNFFVIDIEWFLNWKCFVSNDTTEKNLTNNKKNISPNKNIGILPPGPITNFNLFEKQIKDYSFNNLKKYLKKVCF